jgi:TIR domain-containing protein
MAEAHVPGFAYDVLVSYAHVDDDLPPGETLGWVSHFQRDLFQVLARRLGGDEAFIHFTNHSMPGGHANRGVAEAARRSAMLLVVLSPGYCASEHCRWELEAFLNGNESERSRALIVIYLRRVDEQTLPPILRACRFYQFWHEDERGFDRPFDFRYFTDPELRYFKHVDELATDVAKRLKILRDTADQIASEATSGPPSSDSNTPSPDTDGDKNDTNDTTGWRFSGYSGGARIGAGASDDIGASHESALSRLLRSDSRIGAARQPAFASPMRQFSPQSTSRPDHARAAAVQTATSPAAQAEPASRPTIASPAIDAVGFGVAHPAAINSATSFIIDTWIFQNTDRKDAEQRALASMDGDVRFRSQGSAAVPRGSKLTVTVKIGNWPVTPRLQDVWWTGEIANVSFRVTPAAKLPGEKIDGECRISLDGLRIGYVPFQIAVAGTARQSDHLTVGTTVKSAFASYASRDRSQVLARVQGIGKAGIDVFMDIHNLRSGSNFNTELLSKIESSDVLYLFWSRHAAASEWVGREWRYGMEKKGIDFIDPVPLADPRKVPPPAELAGAKHFNDWTLAYLEYERTGGLWRRLRSWVAGN